MTRVYKAPKTRVWALKSQENVTLFEDPTDFIHVFSTDDRTWDAFWRGITSARVSIFLSRE